MPHRNRVDPFGRLLAVPERGAWFGNRGCLHDDTGTIRRGWTTRAWICCVLSFKGRRRALLTPGRYTELFFMDEATALAAGHRPCAECRRADFNRFSAHAARGLGLTAPLRAGELDARLHAERVDPATRGRRTHALSSGALPDGALPDGAMIAHDGDAFLIAGGRLHRWSPGGYTDAGPLAPHETVEVLTPPTILAGLADGYRPQIGVAGHA